MSLDEKQCAFLGRVKFAELCALFSCGSQLPGYHPAARVPPGSPSPRGIPLCPLRTPASHSSQIPPSIRAPPASAVRLSTNLRQSALFQFGNNSNYMNMAEASNAFFAASEVGVCLRVSVHGVCVPFGSFTRLEGESKVGNFSHVA